jgi:hypothetical protein
MNQDQKPYRPSNEVISDLIRALIIELQERGANKIAIEIIKSLGIGTDYAKFMGWID